MKLFVIGGGSGLGAAIVKLSRQRGIITGYSTSAPPSEEATSSAPIVANCDLHNPEQLQRLIGEITAFAPDRLIICPIHTRYERLDHLSPADIAADIQFNISNIISVASAYATLRPTGSITFLLSHICFLYNPGFTLYKAGKDAVDSFAKAIQFEFPRLEVLRVYPGAMKTNFAANTRYSGLTIFPPKDPAVWADRILNKEHGCLIGPVDFLFMLATRILPFAIQKFLFQELIFNRRGSSP